MTEILIATWAAVISALSGLWDLLEIVALWVGSVLYHLHVDAPRLEGLLVGVLLTWVLLRRDRHPLLRVLSAPLKLIVDILDLAWDQVSEVAVDVKETVANWLNKSWDLCVNIVKKPWDWLLRGLKRIKENLSSLKKKNEPTEETE